MATFRYQLILFFLNVSVLFGHFFFSQLYDPHTIFRIGLTNSFLVLVVSLKFLCVLRQACLTRPFQPPDCRPSNEICLNIRARSVFWVVMELFL